MELRHLRYFVIVAEEQNVTRAAERLHVSQPPLSRQIRDLEEELGVELFRRTAKSLALTEAGKIFLNEARAVLLRAEGAVQTVRAMGKGGQHLRVGYAPSLTTELLPRALRLFEAEAPGVRVSLHDLSSEECVQRLGTRKIDLALTVRPCPNLASALTFEKLTSYPLCCAVPVFHPLAQRRALRAELLKDEKFIIYSHEDYPEYRPWLQQFCKAASFEPRATEEYDGVNGLIAAVEAGRGIAVVTTSIKTLAGPRLKLVPLKTPMPPTEVGALRARGNADGQSELADRFIAALKRAVK